MLRARRTKPAAKRPERCTTLQRRPRCWSSKPQPQRNRSKSKRVQAPTPSYSDALAQAVRIGAVPAFCTKRPATNPDAVVHLLRTLAPLYDKHRLTVEELSTLAPLLSEALWRVVPRLTRKQLQRTVQCLAKLQLQATPALWERLTLRAQAAYTRAEGVAGAASAVRPVRYDASWLHSLQVARMLDAGAAQGRWRTSKCGELIVHDVSMPVRSSGPRWSL